MTMTLIGIALFSSLIALGFSVGAWRAMRHSSPGRLLRMLGEQSEAQEALQLQVRSLKVRVSALSRPRKNGKFVESDESVQTDDASADPRRDPEAWKREMNLKLALGRVKP